jgi:hypothetical protein
VSRARPARLAPLLAALLGAGGCAWSLISHGELREEPFARIVERTARARGIAPEGEVRTRVIATAELPAILERALSAEWSAAEIRSYQEGLTTLGLWPAGRDLLAEFVAVYSEEVVGLYLPVERTLYLVRDAPSSFALRVLSAFARRDFQREVILAHELVHLLQHQAHPELHEGAAFWKHHDDAGAAVQAALEGDALRYGFEALEVDPPAAEELRRALEGESDRRTRGALAEAPALLRLTVAFPYTHGYGLSLREGRELLAAPPASTEQVLHPERRREAFLALDLAPLRPALPAGCALVFENTLGELGLSVLFRDLAGEHEAAAWQGWDGDRWLVAQCAGRRELLWLTAWDSEADAAEFAAAQARIAPAVAERAQLAGAPEARVAGREVRVASPGLIALRERLGDLARRERVADLAGLRAHFAAP